MTKTIVLMLSTIALISGCTAQANAPDLILTNAHVVTVDASDSIAEALAISGDTLIAVGSAEEIAALAGPQTEIIDLGGVTVTPGIIDTHNHFAWSMLSKLAELDLEYPTVRNITDVRQQLAAAIQNGEAGKWISGWHWDAAKLEEQRDILAADLDDLSPDNPVWLMHTSGHYGVANSRAMMLAGIDATTADPSGGMIGRDAEGNPNGILADQAMDLIDQVIPATTTADYLEAVTRFAPDLSAEGITSVKDPEINEHHWAAYQAAEKNGDLPVRVFTLWRAPDTLEEARALRDRILPITKPHQSNGSELVVSTGVKIYVDGSGTARTAWMYDDWNQNFSEVDTGNTGLTYLPPELLLQQFRLFHSSGIHIGTHAIGDRAIDFTMDSYQQVLSEDPRVGLRHSIIHCNLPTNHAMDLMVKLQREFDAGYPEVQPAFLWWLGDVYLANFGPERGPHVLPLRTFEERGILWAGSSDYDVSPYALRHSWTAAATRQPMLGTYGEKAWGTAEQISVQEVLRAYTATAARQVFLEDRIGTLEAGKLADVTVWDRNLYTASTESLAKAKPIITLMNGRIVYRAGTPPESE